MKYEKNNEILLKTPVAAEWKFPLLNPHATLASIGSCFSEAVVSELLDSGFHGCQNPNGILYNPYSIQDAVQRLDIGYSETDFFEFQGMWHSWRHHGCFSAQSVQNAVENANLSCRKFFKTLKKADIFIVTLSSAVVYRFLPANMIVANCHKVPGTQFNREMLSVESCRACLRALTGKIREWNKKCIIMYTVSPVCHYPGDILLNSKSKSHLLSAVYDVIEENSLSCYFPAFEIMNYELRDYRFYDEDMLHPSKIAEKIILERFIRTCCTPSCYDIYLAAEERRRKSCHRPISPMMNPPQSVESEPNEGMQ